MAAQDAVTFGASNPAAAVVTLDGSWTVGTVNFASSNSYTLAPGANGDGCETCGVSVTRIVRLAWATATVLMRTF